MPATEGDDILTDTSGDDTIDALGGNDTITVTAGNDLVQGGAGTDRLIVDYHNLVTAVINQAPSPNYVGRFSGGDRSVEYSGIELLTVLTGSGDDNVAGGGGNDIISTGAGIDTIDGGAGDDTIDGGAGADTMTGYLGNDIYLADSGDTIIERDFEGYDTVYVNASYALGTDLSVSRIEVLSAASWRSVTAIDLTGNDIANRLYGNAGTNVLDGKGGADFMAGFGGNDIYYIDNAGDVVSEGGGNGYDIVYITVAPFPGLINEELEEIHVLDRFSTYTISVGGTRGDNILTGNDGNNAINGNGGADIMYGYAGDDTYYADTGDIIVELDGQGHDKLITNGSDLTNGYYALAAGVSIEEIEGALNHSYHITGNEFGQTITTGSGSDADFLDGGGGADTLVGGGGNDSYVIDALDTVIDSYGYDTVYVGQSYVLSNDLALEVLSTVSWGAADAINLTANNLANQLFGNTGDNVLDGKEGSDILTGFRGADSFAFTSVLGASNVDTIRDFEQGSDRILLDDAVFAGLTPGALPAAAFVTGSAATDADDRIIYDQTTGALSFDADGSGSGAAVQFATLLGAPTIAASDFMVI